MRNENELRIMQYLKYVQDGYTLIIAMNVNRYDEHILNV